MAYLKSITLAVFIGATAMLPAQQQTVGLFLNTAEAYEGYTLFAPLSSTTTYLINNCGEKVHSWNSSYRPGLAVYLLENGILLRTGNTANPVFTAGGTGGIIEMIDWNGNVIWNYTISSTSQCQHHDIEYLPNGNILAVVWEAYTGAEAAQAGRTTFGTALWSEKIIEIQPDLVQGGGTIVWEWKVWDHLVQDQNASLANYGSVGNSPELIDINFTFGNPSNADWLHINAVDYNAELDQIILSNHNFSEIWIIDHSTTTQEASSHDGGNSGMGGDLLYRWGNPQAYQQGNANDQMLFLQHDANWIDEGYIDGGMIMIFNNRAGDPSNADYSAVNVIAPPIDAFGNYTYSGTAFLPGGFHWTYTAEVPTDFFAENISGARRLANGNTLICEGPSGRFFEVDYSGDIVWEYVNPVNNVGIINQYAPATANRTFRAERYPSDYPGFNGQTLTPQGYIESGSTFDCEIFTTATDEWGNQAFNTLNVSPNPAQNRVTVSGSTELKTVMIYNLNGQKIWEQHPNQKEAYLNVSQFVAGTYIIKALTNQEDVVIQKMIVGR